MDIIISAGHNFSDPGAQSDGINEATLTMSYRDALASVLRSMGYRVITPRDNLSLRQTIQEALAFPKTLAIELHFNAYNGEAHGVEAFYTKADYLSLEVSKAILKACETTLGLKNRGAKTSAQSHRKRLGFTDDLKHGIILEICFMDNLEDRHKVQNVHRWAEVVAKAIDKKLVKNKDV